MNNLNLTIEKGVPLPPLASGGYKDTFKKMEVGDSVFIRTDSVEKVRASISGTLASLKSSLNRDYATRKVEGGLRVWRVS